MTDVQALTAALEYLEALGLGAPANAAGKARVLIQQLADRGFVVRAPSEFPLKDRSPANLLAVRRQLGLRPEDVAREAGIALQSVFSAENPTRRPRIETISAVADALARLAVKG